jgi:hypothetical protein
MAKPVTLRGGRETAAIPRYPNGTLELPQSTRTRIDPALSDILSTAAMSA